MADIIFKCTTCGQAIAVDEVGAGQTLPCPKCKTASNIPDPERRFSCPHCAVELATGSQLGTDAKSAVSFDCPSCRRSIKFRLEDSVDADDGKPTTSDDRKKDLPEILATCPKCGRDDVPFVCPNCEKSSGGITFREDNSVLCFCGIVTDRIACPHCNATILAKWFRPEPETTMPSSQNPPLRLRDSVSPSHSIQPNAPGALPKQAVCSHCATPREPDAVLCVNCGLDFRTGKRLQTIRHNSYPQQVYMSAPRRKRGTLSVFEQLFSFVGKLIGIAFVGGIIVWAISAYQDNQASSKRNSQRRVAAESRSPSTPPSRSPVSASATQSTSTSRQVISEREREPQRSQARSPDDRARQEQDRRALQQRRIDELQRYMAATYNREARVFEQQYDADRKAIQFNRVEKSFIDNRNMAISLWNEYGMAGAPHPGPPVTFHIARVRFDHNIGLWVVYHEQLATY